MDVRNEQRRPRSSGRRKKRYGLYWAGLCVILLGAGLAVYDMGRPDADKGGTAAVTPAPPPVVRFKEAVEFRMADLEHGWVRYTDGWKTTADGGATWVETDQPPAAGQAVAVRSAESGGSPAVPSADANLSEEPDGYGWLRLKDETSLASLSYQGADYAVKQAQFMTDRIGWALVQDSGALAGKLLVTTDGGATWQADGAGGTVRDAIGEEKELLRQRQLEAAQYVSEERAKQVFRSEWLLLPDTASPGDAVLVRHSQAGDVQWQGKTYTLQRYGSAYFTYLPIGMDVKPGSYPLGDQTLKIVAKKFETQYLKVTEEMDSMRQDTKRIDADQKKIDAARSQSEPEFLFREPFVVPVEGILTTPYGYTRYVNGKWSGSHMAIDLAAKEGTPIKATNDGIVALADSLYLTGNSIYLDHGMGLFSQYAHLSKLNVKTGDRVKRGDIIGLVGTTGFSTGPHLHFTFWVHNIQANPNLFMGKSPFQWTAAAK